MRRHSLIGLLLAERARSECARSTRALEDGTRLSPTEVGEESLEEEGMKADGLLCSRNAWAQEDKGESLGGSGRWKCRI